MRLFRRVLSVDTARRVCTAAAGGGITDYQTTGFAQLSTHAHRGLERWNERELAQMFKTQGAGFLCPYVIELPLWELKRGLEADSDTRIEVQVPVSVLLPFAF